MIQKYKGFFFFVFILSAAGLVLTMFGTPGGQGPNNFSFSEVVAKVEGKEITAQEVIRAYQYQRQMMLDEIQKRAGGADGKNQEMRKYLESLVDMRLTPDSVVGELVQEKFVMRTAERLGIQASPEIIRDIIQNDPRFQKDGRFDPLLYRQQVTQTGLFEEDVGQRAAVYRMSELFQAGLAFHSPSESELESWLNKKSKYAVLSLKLSEFKDPASVSSSEVEAFLKDPASEGALTDFYNRNLSRFTTEEQVKARHILFKGDNAKAEATKILAEISSGKLKFEDAALQFSQDKSNATKGGDLGFFGRGVMDPGFEKAAFALKAGGLTTEPVESSFGFHLIRVDERKEASSKSLADVKAEIASEVLLEKLRREKALKVLNQITAGVTFGPAELKKMGLSWSEPVSWGPLDSGLGSLGVIEGDDITEILRTNANRPLIAKPLMRGETYHLVKWVGLDQSANQAGTVLGSADELNEKGAWQEAKAQMAYRHFLQTRFEDLEKSKKIYRSEKILKQFREVLKAGRG